MPDPSSFLQWLHQTYNNQWKGTVDITTVPAEDHAPKNSHWISTITASGAVVKSKADGKNHTLEPITATGDARAKKAAEHAAAEKIYRQLVQEGWWDPEGPAKPKKAAGVSRAHRFITDNTPCNEHNPLAYMDVSIAGQPAGRIIFELFRYKKGSTQEQHAPLAVDNFLAFCQGVDVGGRHLSYVGVPFTRVVKRFVVQAGDVVNNDGTGGAHIHSSFGEHFPDEGLDDKNYRHTFPFMLSAANLGLEDTNSSQFFITVAPCASLDGFHTCFGKVLRGYSTVKEIESVHLLHSASGCSDKAPEGPPVPVVITAAGELAPGTALDDTNAPLLRGGGYPMWAEDQGPPPEGVPEVSFRLDISSHLKQLGNDAYKQGDARGALRLYRQAYQYLSWTTFKRRLPDGDVDMTYDEQDAIWQAEGVLLCNMVAAQNKLGQYKAAVEETCPDLFRKSPDAPKVYLRAAQAHIGLGPGQYDTAVSLLQEALRKAQQQQAPTRDIVAELHRVKDLRRGHTAKLRAAFTSAFNSGLLHHPADDTPPSAAAAAGRQPGTAASRTWRGMPVAGGPVEPQRVLEDASKPVMDAWGIHPLVVDDDYDYDDGGDGSTGQQQRSWGQQRLTDLLLQQARLGRGSYGPSAAPTAGSNGAAAAAAGVDDGWGGLLGSGGYDDAGLAAEEAAGGWWREEGDSEEGEEEAAAAAGGEDIAPEGEVLLLQQQEQQEQEQQQQQQQRGGTDGHPNGSSNGSSNGYHEAAAEGLGGDSGECDVVSSGEECEGECDVGVPEAEDVVGQEVVVVSDSSGVSKRGYGWKPEALPAGPTHTELSD